MANVATKLPEKASERSVAPSSAPRTFHPLERMRREMDRLFSDFDRGFLHQPFRHFAVDLEPFWRHDLSWGSVPAVDIAEQEKQYEITAELPGMSESDIEIKVSNDVLTIKGEKKSEKEEKKKDYFLSERHYGTFARSFHIPDGVDSDKIAADFKNGVLTVTLPKTQDAQKLEKKIEIKTA
jgi:HSP20 family protein